MRFLKGKTSFFLKEKNISIIRERNLDLIFPNVTCGYYV